MTDDRNESDRILGEGWVDPGFRRYSEAWDKHPQRELLDEHKAEVGDDRMPKWGTVREVLPGGWVEYWQRPTDPDDGRESIRIGVWPERLETDELASWAIVDEHDDTAR